MLLIPQETVYSISSSQIKLFFRQITRSGKVNLNLEIADSYSISANVVKSIKDVITFPLIKIINRCIKSNIFPDALKVANVIPLNNKENIEDISNYRSASLLLIL